MIFLGPQFRYDFCRHFLKKKTVFWARLEVCLFGPSFPVFSLLFFLLFNFFVVSSFFSFFFFPFFSFVFLSLFSFFTCFIFYIFASFFIFLFFAFSFFLNFFRVAACNSVFGQALLHNRVGCKGGWGSFISVMLLALDPKPKP